MYPLSQCISLGYEGQQVLILFNPASLLEQLNQDNKFIFLIKLIPKGYQYPTALL